MKRLPICVSICCTIRCFGDIILDDIMIIFEQKPVVFLNFSCEIHSKFQKVGLFPYKNSTAIRSFFSWQKEESK